MSKLYEIANEYAKLIDSDLEPEMIADTIEGMEGEFTDKIEQLLSVIKNESGYAERLKEEAKSLNERAAVIQNKIDSIKSYIASSLEMVGKKNIRAGIHQVTIRKPSEIVEIIDSSALPPEYVEFETTIKADKLAIKNQLKSGITIPGAQLSFGKPSLLLQ
ncbi:siphovirus Gp157 family protein [Escherichia coli]|nr:siphovirus Gp157 family protein [Escherichia coli]